MQVRTIINSHSCDLNTGIYHNNVFPRKARPYSYRPMSYLSVEHRPLETSRRSQVLLASSRKDNTSKRTVSADTWASGDADNVLFLSPLVGEWCVTVPETSILHTLERQRRSQAAGVHVGRQSTNWLNRPIRWGAPEIGGRLVQWNCVRRLALYTSQTCVLSADNINYRLPLHYELTKYALYIHVSRDISASGGGAMYRKLQESLMGGTSTWRGGDFSAWITFRVFCQAIYMPIYRYPGCTSS